MPKTLSCKLQQAFTLIELSIVMVIIGLVIGGVLVGRDLIRVAEMRAIFTEKEKFITSVMTFRSKYNCLAGDCRNATDFFGQNSAGCPAPMGSAATMSSCNGNDNGILDGTEQYTIWQQLAAANLQSGIFRGTQNVASSVDKTVYPEVKNHPLLYWYFDYGETATLLGTTYNKHIISNIKYTNYADMDSRLFTPYEALAFDSKYDDGKPASGNIQAYNFSILADCTDPETAPAPNAVYWTDATNSNRLDKNCNLFFLNLGF